MAQIFCQLVEKAREGNDLKTLGVYQPGNDPVMDRAVGAEAALLRYLQQPINERQTFTDSLRQLQTLMVGMDADGHR